MSPSHGAREGSFWKSTQTPPTATDLEPYMLGNKMPRQIGLASGPHCVMVISASSHTWGFAHAASAAVHTKPDTGATTSDTLTTSSQRRSIPTPRGGGGRREAHATTTWGGARAELHVSVVVLEGAKIHVDRPERKVQRFVIPVERLRV